MQGAGIVVHLPVNFCIVKFFLEDFLLEHLQGEMHFDHNPTRKRGIDPSLTRRVMIDANFQFTALAVPINFQ